MTEEEQTLLNEHEFKFLTRDDCELTSRMSVLHYFSGNKNYDCIIHLAACVGGLFMNMNNGIKMFSDNININENILDKNYSLFEQYSYYNDKSKNINFFTLIFLLCI